MRFLSWECWDFWRWHDHFRRFSKKSEVFRRRPTSTDGEVIEKMLIHKIRVLPFIYFTHGFNSLHGSELTYFWKLCQEKWQQLTFFNQAWEIGLQAWAGVRSKFSTRRRESWQVYAFQNTVRGKIYRYDLRSLPCLAVFVFFPHSFVQWLKDGWYAGFVGIWAGKTQGPFQPLFIMTSGLVTRLCNQEDTETHCQNRFYLA